MDDTTIETADNAWYAHEGGATLGEPGFDSGIILRDEEFGDPGDAEAADARLTLERGSRGVESRRLTANIYGWFQGARDYETETDAHTDFDMLKTELPLVANLIPDEESKNIGKEMEMLNAAIADLRTRFALREDL